MDLVDARAELESAQAVVAALDYRLRAVITPMFDSAAVDLESSETRLQHGDRLPLLGVTVSVKDNIDSARHLTSCGSAFFADRVPARDAEVVRRLRAAGASVVAKVNTDEFALGSTTQSSYYGPSRNPWSLDRVPGGSSGGSGVAVASGMCRVSIGTDTGGSIRLPAALNGICGLRPSRGRVSVDGVWPVSDRLDTVGPLARSAADLELIFRVLDDHPAAVAPASAGPRDALGGIRVGIPADFFLDDVDPAISRAVEEAARVLESQGARLVSVRLPLARHTRECIFTVGFADAAQVHRDRLETEPERFSPSVRTRLEEGRRITPARLTQAVALWAGWQGEVDAAFETVDLIITPTVSAEAPTVADAGTLAGSEALGRFTGAWALASGPTVVLPCGSHRSGLPIGLQLSAAKDQDYQLLRIARAFQDITDWHLRRPPPVEPDPAAATEPGADPTRTAVAGTT